MKRAGYVLRLCGLVLEARVLRLEILACYFLSPLLPSPVERRWTRSITNATEQLTESEGRIYRKN